MIVAFFLTAADAQKKMAQNMRLRRLALGLTQAELSARSGVPLPSLRRFEQKADISLESFLKLQAVVGGLHDIVSATEQREIIFSSIDEVLSRGNRPERKRGRRK